MGNRQLDDELETIKSRSIALKALQQLNIGTRYFTKKNFKTYELYKKSPFVVKHKFIAEEMKGNLFHLTPIDENSFTLSIKPSSKDKFKYGIKSILFNPEKDEKPIEYNEVHQFGKEIITPWFDIVVHKIFTLNNQPYQFNIFENHEMYEYIQNNFVVGALSLNGSTIKLYFEDTVPQRAAEILDSIAHTYINENLNLKTQSAKKTLDFIDAQLASINKTLKKSEDTLKSYKSKNTVLNITEKASLTAAKLSEHERSLFEIGVKIDVLENILNYIETHNTIDGINIDSTQTNQTINSIVINIQNATTTYKSLLVDYTELHPDVIKVTKELISLKHTLKESIKNNLRGLKNRKEQLSRRISKQTKQLQTLPEQEQKLTQLTRSFLVNEKIYSYLLEKRAETSIIKSSSVTESRILDKALIPKYAIKPKRALIVTVGFLLGIFISITIVLVRSYFDNTIINTLDIEQLTTTPIYGTVPLITKKKNMNPLYEAIRGIRTNLQFLQDNKNSKLITITSSISGEGKTTILTELGKVIAQNNKKVILLDLDMRQPNIHEKFGLENANGMSTLLSGKHNLADVIFQNVVPNLDIVTAGPIPPNPSELIMSEVQEFLLTVLLKTYDYVLLDSPPIGLVTDATLLMRKSDINLIVYKANYSKKFFIRNMNRFINDHELEHTGIILNGIDVENNIGYGYSYS